MVKKKGYIKANKGEKIRNLGELEFKSVKWVKRGEEVSGKLRKWNQAWTFSRLPPEGGEEGKEAPTNQRVSTLENIRQGYCVQTVLNASFALLSQLVIRRQLCVMSTPKSTGKSSRQTSRIFSTCSYSLRGRGLQVCISKKKTVKSNQ